MTCHQLIIIYLSPSQKSKKSTANELTGNRVHVESQQNQRGGPPKRPLSPNQVKCLGRRRHGGKLSQPPPPPHNETAAAAERGGDATMIPAPLVCVDSRNLSPDPRFALRRSPSWTTGGRRRRRTPSRRPVSGSATASTRPRTSPECRCPDLTVRGQVGAIHL